jgi:hypothetical protein
MGTHHLILGKTADFLTGKTVDDTHDERARQKIARLLVNEKGYAKSEIQAGQQLHLELDGKTGTVSVDFTICPENEELMLILFRPGSIVSRRRTALACARLFRKEAIPYTVVTNGEDAEILETASGRVIGTGLEAVFSRSRAIRAAKEQQPLILSEDRREKEKRILFAMEVLTQKECDDYTCQN